LLSFVLAVLYFLFQGTYIKFNEALFTFLERIASVYLEMYRSIVSWSINENSSSVLLLFW